MNKRFRFGRLLVAVVMVMGCGLFAAEAVRPVKYLFLFIGDGLSIPQRMTVEEYRRRTEERGLVINALPVQGSNTTYASNSFITDSAASGTAIACGSKTRNGRLGVDADGKPLESVATLAKKQGYRVGILSSVGLNHATPGAFYAHNVSRGNYYEIALELLSSGFDFWGGGRPIDADGEKRKDFKGVSENILVLAEKQGFAVAEGKAGLERISAASKRPVLAVTTKPSGSSLPYAIDAAGSPEATLADYVAKAIEVLDNPAGFFLMAEGGMVDWLCHANDAAGTMREVIAFDDAVAVAVEFAKRHPDETLIVVTGDHETGGLTLGFAGTGYTSYLEELAKQKSSGAVFTKKFQALKKEQGEAMTFKLAEPLITASFGLLFSGDAKRDRMVLSAQEIASLERAYRREMGDESAAPTENLKVLYGSYPPLTVAALHLVANKSGVGWNTFAHTAMPVGTSASGVNAERFSGLYDNIDIANRLKAILLAPPRPAAR